MMKVLLPSVRLFRGTFMFSRIMILVLMSAAYMPLYPMLTKLNATYLTVFGLTVVTLCKALSGIVPIYLRWLSINIVYVVIMLTDLLIMLGLGYIAVYMAPNIDKGIVQDTGIYLIIFITVTIFIQDTLLNIYNIKVENFVSKKYSNDYEDFKYSLKTMNSVGMLVAISLGLVVSSTLNSFGTCVVGVIMLGGCLVLELAFYKSMLKENIDEYLAKYGEE